MLTTLHSAVLVDSEMVMLNGKKAFREPATASNFGELCELGLKHNVRNIWLVPGSELSNSILDAPDPWTNYSDARYWVKVTTAEYGKVKYPSSCFIHRVAGTYDERRTVNIFIPQLDNRWNEDKVGGWQLAQIDEQYSDPAMVLLGALHYLHISLGVDIESPGHTGIELMKLVNTKKPEWVQPADLSALPMYIELDIETKRTLTEEEAKKKYVHVYDRNSMYLAAATGAWLGQGTPKYRSSSYATPDFKLPGVWWVTVHSAPDDLRDWLPMGKPAWMYSSMVEMLVETLKCQVEIYEGWEWEKGNKALQPWGKLIWDTRQSLNSNSPLVNVERFKHADARYVAYMMIKRIATQGIGWLDLTAERRREKKSQWHRPDWKNQVVALARARMLLTIHNMFTKYGALPCMVDTDALVYVSDELHPAFEADLMVRKDGLGGFKHDRTVLLTQEIIKAFSGPRTTPNDIKRLINKSEKVGA